MNDLTERHYGFSLGHEVFLVGAFVGRVGDKRNIPIVRIGNMAAMLSEPIWPMSTTRPAYLIETRSLGGISGSPVFFCTSPDYLRSGPREPYKNSQESPVSILPYLLVGMIINSHSGQYSTDFAANEEDICLSKDADYNAGISVALPVEQILEALNHPILQQSRDETIQTKPTDIGVREA